MEYVVSFLFGVVAIFVFSKYIVKHLLRRARVVQYERGLKYTRGKFVSVVEPGQYWFIPLFTSIEKIDIRPRFVSITGQEVLSADGVALKVSLAANFEIVDPIVAINAAADFQEALYLELQLALRAIIGSADIDVVLNKRDELSKSLLQMTESKAAELGLRLISVNLKDIMFPGKLKETFARVVNARKESLAALEKARGETAALRSLANAARMLDDNPNLMQLRFVHALGESSGNTVMLGVPAQATAVAATRRARGNGGDGENTGESPQERETNE